MKSASELKQEPTAEDRYTINSQIWEEEAEPQDPYVTRAAYCSGYDVYGDLLGRISWVEMLYLLFHREPPTSFQAKLLEMLAVTLANPGPRDASVHAAMAAGVGGSTAASVLIAALSVGAGQVNGSREVFELVKAWQQCGVHLEAWQSWCASSLASEYDEDDGTVWPSEGRVGRVMGFDAEANVSSTVVRQVVESFSHLAHVEGKDNAEGGKYLAWLGMHQKALEQAAHAPMTLMFPVAAAFHALDFSPEQAEMLCLMLRLPGAAAHALEQWQQGFRQFPFGKIEVVAEAS